LNNARAARQQEVPRVEAIVAEEAGAFLNWLRGLEITPLIADLHAQAATIRRAEAGNRHAAKYAAALRFLFALND